MYPDFCNTNKERKMGDTTDKINCPACGKEMAKIYLDIQKFNVDICTEGCGGIFLDNRELKKLDENHEDITPILEAIKDKTFQRTNEALKRICPVCGHTMVKNYTDYLKNIQIDECYNCGGKFFDAGELIKTRNEYKTEGERISAFNKYAKELYKDSAIPPKSKKTFGSMINQVLENYKEFN